MTICCAWSHHCSAVRSSRDVLDDALMMSSSSSFGWYPMSAFDFRDIRHPPRHVLEAGLVGLVVRDVLDGRLAAGERLHPLGQLANRHLARYCRC